ncbi:hypothetical protein [Streptomyces sp. CB02923]|uniref:hypothetical protein n=1 Tax=Streptomyces sp. CB02923 TaxID=1718985 RepID=UPI0019006074|nr:hypothetical protein [Streptomyces sp. CB02923]
MKNSPHAFPQPRTGAPRPVAQPPPPLRSLSPATAGAIGGQLLAGAGLVLQWIGEPARFPGFPPGLVYIAAAAAIVWLDRRSPWSPVAAVVLSLWIVGGGLAGGNLTANLASDTTLMVAGNAVMLLGLGTSTVAGALAIRHNLRQRTAPLVKPLSAENPRRPAVWIVIAGLLADAIGDAAPEGLRWDGPGPAMFAALAVLVALVPGRAIPLLCIPLSGAFILGVFINPEPLAVLTNPGADALGFGGIVLQLAGLTTAMVASGVAAIPGARRNP